MTDYFGRRLRTCSAPEIVGWCFIVFGAGAVLGSLVALDAAAGILGGALLVYLVLGSLKERP